MKIFKTLITLILPFHIAALDIYKCASEVSRLESLGLIKDSNIEDCVATCRLEEYAIFDKNGKYDEKAALIFFEKEAGKDQSMKFKIIVDKCSKIKLSLNRCAAGKQIAMCLGIVT